MRLTAILALLVGCGSEHPFSDSCGPWPGVQGVLPPDGAEDVAVNVRPMVRFEAGKGSNATVELETADARGVAGTAQELGGAWVFVPDAPLAPNAEYALRVRASDVAAYTSRFVTGEAEDVEPPRLRTVTVDSWEWLHAGTPGDECGPGDTATNQFAVMLDIPPVAGEADPRQVEHQVFVTRSGETDAPFEIAHGYPEADGRTWATAYVPVSMGEGETCFAVVARDAASNYSGASPDVCVELEPGPYFESCSVGVTRRGARPDATILVLWGALVLGARRRSR